MAYSSSIFDVTDIKARIKSRGETANKAAALAVNKATTYAIREAISDIQEEANLQQAYISKHLRTVSRASSKNLRAVIAANARETLLTRYPYRKTAKGVAVSVGVTGYREIPKAFIVRGLRGSQATGIALSNKEALALFEKRFSKGQSTPGKQAKLAKLRSKAKQKPRGIEVLHSRSINQLFTSSRTRIQPQITAFMVREFLADFDRLSI